MRTASPPPAERRRYAEASAGSAHPCGGSGGRSAGWERPGVQRRHTGHGGQPGVAILAQQTERAGRRDRRQPSGRPGGGCERQHRSRGLQRGHGQHLPLHRRRRRLGHLLLVQQRRLVGPADLHRLQRANLTSNFPERQAFKGFEAVAVSRIDGPASTGLTQSIVSDQANWQAPVIVSKQNSALFSDKEQVWADNASSSPFFGNAYICYGAFRSPPGVSQPLIVATSTNGGDTWTNHQITPATNNTSSKNGFGRSGCTIRTDSHGVAYVFAFQFGSGLPGVGQQLMATSTDGGAHWTQAKPIFPATDLCTGFEPAIGRCVEDGIGGARDDLGPAPSVDIANGAPTGADATNQIINSWADGRAGLNHEQVLFASSTNGGATWTAPRAIETAGDRGYYAAPAISPNGTDAWVVYNAYTTPFRNDTTSPRNLVGVVKHADVAANGTVGAFTEVHRSPGGDPRGSSQNNLAAEFLGDYVYAAATRTYGAAVWNDVRNAAVCTDVNTYRQALHDQAVGIGAPVADPEEPRGEEAAVHEANKTQQAEPVAPAVQQVCPATFGNSDIFGGTFADPTP